MKYVISWTRKNGEKVTGQIYTSEYITRKLQELEREQAKEIVIACVDCEGEK